MIWETCRYFTISLITRTTVQAYHESLFFNTINKLGVALSSYSPDAVVDDDDDDDVISVVDEEVVTGVIAGEGDGIGGPVLTPVGPSVGNDCPAQKRNGKKFNDVV